MTNITVSIDESSRRRYRVREKLISFQELRRRIIERDALTSLRTANLLARKAGLRKLSRKDIEAEIQAARHGSRRP